MPFLVVEGVDGSGKSTVIEELRRVLEGRGVELDVFREPGSTKLGEGLRGLLLHLDSPLHPWAEAALFTAARAQLVSEQIKPALEAGRSVLLDRYYYSTLAYQGYGCGLSVPQLEALSESAIQGVLPDAVLILDLPVDQARARLEGSDRLESRSAEYFASVRKGYLSLASSQPERFTVLDAGRGREEVVRGAITWGLAAWGEAR